MCVLNSIKPLSLKPGGGWLSFFFLAVSRGPRWGPRSDTVHIALFVQVGPILCLSGIIKIHKSVYLQGLFLPKWIDIGPALSVYCCERGSGGIKKKLSVTWISVSLLFSGLCAFSWCGKNQQRHCCCLRYIEVSAYRKKKKSIKCNKKKKNLKRIHLKYHQCSSTIHWAFILVQPPTKIFSCTM